MILTVSIDAYSHQIDSTDPELLGKWIIEIFGRYMPFSMATQVRFQAYPSWGTDETGQGRPDWIANTAIIGQPWPVRSPRELLDALATQLDRAEILKDA